LVSVQVGVGRELQLSEPCGPLQKRPIPAAQEKESWHSYTAFSDVVHVMWNEPGPSSHVHVTDAAAGGPESSARAVPATMKIAMTKAMTATTAFAFTIAASSRPCRLLRLPAEEGMWPKWPRT
jgi:hypothetical protein